jgi:hypothetical protein
LSGYMKYSRSHRLSIISFAISVAPIIWVATVSTILIAWPASSSILGLNTWIATMTLFFVPTMAGAALMIGANYWLIAARIKKIGQYQTAETPEETTKVSLQKPL